MEPTGTGTDAGTTHHSPASEGTDGRGISKRQFLRQLGAAAVGTTGLVGSVGRTRAERGPADSRSRGQVVDGGSWTSIDVVVLDFTSSEIADETAEAAFRGMADCLSTLYEELGWFAGFRVRYETPSAVISETDPDSTDLQASCADAGYTDPVHYHAIYDGCASVSSDGLCIGGSSNNPSTSHWTDEDHYSGLSVKNTQAIAPSVYVRSAHQAMHNYLDGAVSRAVAGDISGIPGADPDSAYDAQHALGSAVAVGSDRRVRTLMADMALGRSQIVSNGACSWTGESDAPQTEIYVSACTRRALTHSALVAALGDWWRAVPFWVRV